jgi:pilus assembly protein FimV
MTVRFASQHPASRGRVRSGRARAAAIAAACAFSGAAAPIAFAADTASAPAHDGGAAAVTSRAQFTVQAGQSLNDVAIAVTQSHDRATLARAAQALFDENPRSFMGHDPSRLKVGAVLNVPALDASGAAASHAVAASFAGVPASAPAASSTAPASTAVGSGAMAQTRAFAPGGASAAVSAQGVSKPAEIAAPQAPANASDLHMWTGAIQPAASAPAEAARRAFNASVSASAANTLSPDASASRPPATVSSLQQLLALKNRVLMELQRAAQPGGTGSRAPAAIVQSSAGRTLSVPANSNGASNAAVPVTLAPGPTAAARQPAEGGSFGWSQMNVGAVSAAGAALLALIVGLAMRRRKRAGSAAAAGGAAPDEATASPASAGAAAALDETPSTSADNFRGESGSSPELRDVSSPSEAAATDDKEAELRAVLVEAPESKRALMGLAELYAERHDVASFDEIAQRIWHLSGGHGPNWRRVASLGYQLDPHNPFYADGAASAGSRVAPLASTGSDARQPVAPTHELRTPLAGAAVSEAIAAKDTDAPGQAEAHEDPQPLASGESEGALTPSAEPTAPPLPEATPETRDATPAASHGDLSTAKGVPAQSIGTPAEPASPTAFPPEAIASLGELDMPLPPRSEPLPHAEAAAAPPVSLSTQPVVAPDITEQQAVPPVEAGAPRVADAIEAGTAGPASVAGLGAARFGTLNLAFDLELPPSPGAPLPTFTPEELAKIARNKLDLAAEYIELGDLAGARALIHEVIESNDAGTRTEARALLSTLAPLS